jgi:hypothetical protein
LFLCPSFLCSFLVVAGTVHPPPPPSNAMTLNLRIKHHHHRSAYFPTAKGLATSRLFSMGALMARLFLRGVRLILDGTRCFNRMGTKPRMPKWKNPKKTRSRIVDEPSRSYKIIYKRSTPLPSKSKNSSPQPPGTALKIARASYDYGNIEMNTNLQSPRLIRILR